MIRWQYKVVQQRVLPSQKGKELDDHPEREVLLDGYGRDGWELVTVSSQSYRRDYDPTALQGYTTYSYFFKRAEPDAIQ